MFESGTRLRHLVTFESGAPTSDFEYSLTNQDGTELATGIITIPAGALSYVIDIDAATNVTAKPLFEQMELSWNYTTATEAIDDSFKYTLHVAIPFPVSEEGVRKHLGVVEDELANDDISLLDGYVAFRELVGDSTDLSSYETAGDAPAYRIAKAIEAAEALRILPSLQIKLPRKYDSGTSSYERWNNIDWEQLRTDIEDVMYDGVLIVDPTFERFPVIEIFGLSDRGVDTITGA